MYQSTLLHLAPSLNTPGQYNIHVHVLVHTVSMSASMLKVSTTLPLPFPKCLPASPSSSISPISPVPSRQFPTAPGTTLGGLCLRLPALARLNHSSIFRLLLLSLPSPPAATSSFPPASPPVPSTASAASSTTLLPRKLPKVTPPVCFLPGISELCPHGSLVHSFHRLSIM